jgi:hypothetical protein
VVVKTIAAEYRLLTGMFVGCVGSTALSPLRSRRELHGSESFANPNQIGASTSSKNESDPRFRAD